MKHLLTRCAVALLTLASAGCATLTVRPIESDIDDLAANGVRFYESSPYLLVYSDGKGGIVSKVVYIADQTKKRVAVPKQILSSLNTSMTFVDGVLTSATAEADATVVPVAVIKALVSAGVFAADEPGRKREPEHALPPPHLYKIVVSGSSLELIGDAGTTPVRITLVPEEKKP